MKKVLLVTVGGSPQPIITAVRSLKPDRVIFFCSGGPRGSHSQVVGEGKPCKIIQKGEVVEAWPNLPTHLNLGERFDPERDLVIIDEPDDPSESYGKVTETIRILRKEDEYQEIMADYTGGTKTMSLALGMAAMDYEVALYLTTRPRDNLNRVEYGEITEMVSTSLIDVDRKIEQFLPVFLSRYNYPAAVSQLENLLKSVQLSTESKKRVRSLLDYCKAFDAWDRFEHSKAWQFLQNCMGEPALREQGLFLKRVMFSREAVDEKYKAAAGMRGHGYEILEDLLLNAERRAIQEHYDDAVARLYRALELLVQVRLLKEYEIKTGNVEIKKIPESSREKYEKQFSGVKKIKLPLRQSYELLTEFSGDPLGELYQEHSENIMDKLEIRNQSILAHGFTPVTSEKYREFSDFVIPFIKSGISLSVPKTKTDPVQFPCELDSDGNK